MRVLLTGANGFVGKYVQQRIACIPLGDNGERIDLLDSNAVDSAVSRIGPDAVIHLAAQSFVPQSISRPKETYDINFYGTFNLLDALRRHGFAGKLIFVSTGDVYGCMRVDELPVTEATPVRPRSPYAVSKVAAEALCYQWSQTEKVELVVARPFNHIGPGQSERFAVSNFARQIVRIKKGQKEPVLHVGDIDVTRDFTDVRDVVSAYEKLLLLGVDGGIYNICSESETSIRSIVETLCEVAGVEIDIVQDKSRVRSVEQRRMRGSAKRLYMDTGWKPTISMHKSLMEILNYWENQPV